MLCFGAVLKYHYSGGQKYKKIQKVSVFLASLPHYFRDILLNKSLNLNSDIENKTKHKNKDRFSQYIKKERNALLVLPRYDQNQKKSIIEIIDLNNFTKIHSYAMNLPKANKLIKRKEKFKDFKTNHASSRYIPYHPLVLDNGSVIFSGHLFPLFKIDICSEIEWSNYNQRYSHSKNLDSNKKLWVASESKLFSKYSKKFEFNDLNEYAINKLSTDDGKILYKKSVMEIFVENNIFPKNMMQVKKLAKFNFLYINDIQPALFDSEYWKKDDVFISLRQMSSIVHYRPSTNKVINYIEGPFSEQHDVDIISQNEISIFNNNNQAKNRNFSEILTYNFSNNKFEKIFNNQLKKSNFKTKYQGLSHIFNDGSILVEESTEGRIILLSKTGKIEWEYVNVDDNQNVAIISWSRVIEDPEFIQNFKNKLKNKQC